MKLKKLKEAVEQQGKRIEAIEKRLPKKARRK